MAKPLKRIYQNETVYLPDLARTGHILTGITFLDCDLRGPAILAILNNNHVENVSFGIEQNDIETILWEVPASYKVGAIGLEGCHIRGGRTQAIGFAGTKDTLDMIRQSLGGTG